ncbi:MAG: ABC transporter permease [Candidatus Bathyarchaeota archaeon]|nr:ABC transporter permease [Candidatus Bathyarchaeota archaeon]
MRNNGKKARTGEWAARWADLKYTLHLLRRNPLVLIGSSIAIFFVALSLFSNYIVDPSLATPRGYPEYGGSYPFQRSYVWSKDHLINWGSGIQLYDGPEFFILGTDGWGRDLFKMIILAIPLDMANAAIITLAAAALGTVLGMLAGYAGGVFDEAVMRVTDIFFAFPALVLALVFAAMFGRSVETLRFAIILVWWPPYVRLMRGQILSEKEKSYVEALKALGAGYPKTLTVAKNQLHEIANRVMRRGDNQAGLAQALTNLADLIIDQLVLLGMHLRILFRHILVNSMYPVLVQATLDFGGVILTFSALMFLGFTPSPSIPELGNLAADGYIHIFDAPWLIVFSGLTMLVIALAFNLVGDGLRDVLDPKLRR